MLRPLSLYNLIFLGSLLLVHWNKHVTDLIKFCRFGHLRCSQWRKFRETTISMQILKVVYPYIKTRYPILKRVSLNCMMTWCQDSSSGNGSRAAYPVASLRVVQQLNCFRNMFREPDISSWDTMPDSWSNDNRIKMIASDVDYIKWMARPSFTRWEWSFFICINLYHMSSFVTSFYMCAWLHYLVDTCVHMYMLVSLCGFILTLSPVHTYNRHL